MSHLSREERLGLILFANRDNPHFLNDPILGNVTRLMQIEQTKQKCIHRLKPFVTPRSSFGCDICHRRFPEGTLLYGCRIDNYDECESCHMRQSKMKHRTNRVCTKGHKLDFIIPYPSYNGFICNECDRRVYSRNVKCYHCNRCKYDLCKSCNDKSKKKKELYSTKNEHIAVLEEIVDSQHREINKFKKRIKKLESRNKNKKKQEKNENEECVICFSEKREFICTPCGHWCLCKNCKTQIHRKCPICRQKCQVIKLFK